MKRRKIWAGLFLALFSLTAIPAQAEPARIVSVRPDTRIVRDAGSVVAGIAMPVSEGTTLETDVNGRASLLLPDQMLLKIDHNTVFTYRGTSAAAGNGELLKGNVWLRGQKRGQSFEVKTPSATAAIRGTEWYMSVGPEGGTTVGVLDGSVAVSNDLGRVVLDSREVAVVTPGKPPVKQVYLVPENAVNWTLNYHGFWDKADLDRADCRLRPLIEQALAAYERNDLAVGRRILAETERPFGQTAAWLALKGFIELVSGNSVAAEAAFVRAAEKDPAWALPPAHLALMRVTENRVKAALVLADQALAAEPDSAVALIAMAYVHKAGLEMDRAWTFARQAAIQSPGFDPANLTAARIALEMEYLKAADAYLEKIPEGSPLAPEKAVLTGFLQLRFGDPEAALAAFEQAVESDPDQYDAFLGRGIAQFNLGREQAGIESILLATLMAPQISALQSYLAKAFLDEEDYDQADKAVARARRLDEKDPTPYLYESLSLFERHFPGRAIRSLSRARELNHNRKVFRSQYLLDQDQAVLMSNVAALYRELGFDYSSINIASRAMAFDPLNAAAYRHLFFAGVFGNPTRPMYLQAMESDKLMAKMLMPPTREAVIFTPGGISPYQPMFVKAGLDFLCYGYGQHIDSDARDTDVKTGYASLTAKPVFPLAVNVAVMPGDVSVDSEFETQTSTGSPGVSSDTQVFNQTDTDGDTLTMSSLMKWQATPFLGVFTEIQSSLSDTKMDSQTVTDSLAQTDLGDAGALYVDSQTISRLKSDGDGDLYNLDAGIHWEITPDTDLMIHAGTQVSDDRTDSVLSSLTTGTTGMTGPYAYELPLDPVSSLTDDRIDMEASAHIIQSTLFKKWRRHLFEAGIRYFKDENETDPRGGPASTVDRYVYTAFFTHQARIVETLVAEWGLAWDRTRYDLSAGLDDTNRFAGYHLGAVWQVRPSTTLRLALIKNTVGDGEKRLQRSRVAGFPLFTLSDRDLFPRSLHLRHRTAAAAIDYELPGYPFFTGLQFENDIGKTYAYEDESVAEHANKDSRINSVQAYLETLITESFSAGLSGRYGDIKVDDRADRWNGYAGSAQMKLSWFFPYGLSLNVQGVLKREKRPYLVKTRAVIPELGWYLADNHVRLTLSGKIEKTDTDTTGDDTAETVIFSGYVYF